MSHVGYFGKLPAHGDFLWEGLPAGFVTPWDEWLQQQIAAVREKNPDGWLDAYLCSPIWRFVLKDPTLGDSIWCGVVTPSVDTVGRYFPFTLAFHVSPEASIAAQISACTDWYEAVETLIVEALQNAVPAEELISRVSQLPTPNAQMRASLSQATDAVVTGVVGDSALWALDYCESVMTTALSAPCFWGTTDPTTGTLHYTVRDGFKSLEQLITGC